MELLKVGVSLIKWALKDTSFCHDLNFDFFVFFCLTELCTCLKS